MHGTANRSADSEAEARARILGALGTRVERGRLPWTYRVAVVAVSCVMLGLPVVYGGIIAGTLLALRWHACAHLDWITTLHPAYGPLCYFVPLAVGSIVVVFLVKPLFAGRHTVEAAKTLTPSDQPFLFAYLERLCHCVGAPVPERVEVDIEANASARFDAASGPGLAGRVLRIGLPLCAHLSLRELTGVLAHEFGHFAQGTGTRLSFVVRLVNGWFWRVVHERDAWDDGLTLASRRRFDPLVAIAAVARCLVWATRRVLAGLMWTGHLSSCYLSRRLEYDADRYEILIAGSAAFEATARRLPLLHHGLLRARERCAVAFCERKLVDDLVDLTGRCLDGLGDDVSRAVDRGIEEERGQLLSTHPRLIDRIRVARELDCEGRIDIDAPGRVVFDHFDHLAKLATWHEHEIRFGASVSRSNLVSVDELIGLHDRIDAEHDGLIRFLHGAPPAQRALDIAAVDVEVDACAELRRLERTRDDLTEIGDTYFEAVEEWLETIDRQVDARVAADLIAAGYSIDNTSFGFDAETAADCDRILETARETGRAIAERRLAPYEAAASRRLAAALRLLSVPHVADGIDGSETLGLESRLLVEQLGLLFRLGPELHDLRIDAHTATQLAEQLEMAPQDGRLAARRDQIEAAVGGRLARLRRTLEAWPYPLGHGGSPTLLSDYAFGPEADSDAIESAWEVVAQLRTLYYRVLGRCCSIAEAAEAAAGIALPELPPSRLASASRKA